MNIITYYEFFPILYSVTSEKFLKIYSCFCVCVFYNIASDKRNKSSLSEEILHIRCFILSMKRK